MTVITENEAGTVRVGEDLGRTLAPGAVVALYGGLGAGKTAFVRGLAAGLGGGADVASPTFTIVNEYPCGIPLFHFDLYRLDGGDELFDIGWDDYLSRGGVCAVEWADKAPDVLPPDAVTVRLEMLGGDKRKIDISGFSVQGIVD
jgi:tRNA threonylcarbamoyladenosine biosynthesis protein TsaE